MSLNDKFANILHILRGEATKSSMNNKHACVAIRHGKMITPVFHNYMRSYMCNFKCGSAHAEFAVINYLLNSGDLKNKLYKTCILPNFTWHAAPS